MGRYFTEKARRLPICTKYDIAVVGGGIAGVSAALSAARRGKKVLLLERMFALGGLATLGLITVYLPLCDGNGKQVSFGIAEELLKLSIRYGFEADNPDTWLKPGKGEHGKQRYQVRFNAQVFSVLMEELIEEAGADILYGTVVTDVLMEEGRLGGLIIENKSGRQLVEAASFVDASGDADVFKLAGAPTALYEKKNSLAAWYYATKDGRTSLHMLGAADVLPDDPDAETPVRIASGRISGVDAWEISHQVRESHRHSLKAFLEKGGVSESHSLTTLAMLPQLRMTRRICGEYTLDETESHRFFEDSIGMIGDWRKCGPVFEIPLRTLYRADIPNLAAAGRCISVTDAMWDIARVIPACAVTGQAAGTAFARNETLTELKAASVQEALKQDGVILHESKIL
ncbi:MAG: FAD-dependent oxidoreductase [Lachnospiraceae bacterium]|nr:FAD-dependent oxidoreductase [Lachnospiraceae bacterium]